MKIWNRGPSSEDLYMFFLQMALYSDIGISPRQALEELIDQFDDKFSAILRNMLRDMKNGASFAVAMKEQKCFPAYYSQIIFAGEESSDLSASLERITNHIQQKQEIKRRMKMALMPVIVPLLAFVTFLGIVMTSVIPSFEEMYASLDKEMPFYTVAVIKTFRFIADYSVVEIILLMVGVTFLHRYFQKNSYKLDQLILKIPIYNKLHKYYLHCNFINVFLMVTGAGFNSIRALEITSNAVGNEVMGRVLKKSVISMKNGMTLHEAIEINNNGVFDKMLINLIATGEKTTKLDEVLVKGEKNFDRLTDTQIRTFNDKVNPWIMIPAAAILVIVLLSIELPMIMVTSGG